MTPQTVIEIFSGAIQLVMLLVMLIVLPSRVVGLVVSIFQAATQINEQTLSFLPRLLTIFVMLMLSGPWILSQLVSYSQSLLGNIPYFIG